MNLFVMDGKDFTHHIKVPSYKVNKEPQYLEWEDGNYSTRREVTRYRVSGTFTMLYDDISELDDFFDTLETLIAASATGAIPITVYLNKLHTVETINAFVTCTPSNDRPLIYRGDLSSFEVTIKEQ